MYAIRSYYEDRVIVRQGKKATVKEKIFPGYLLVKMILDDNTWLAVRTPPGITGFGGVGNKPTPLSASEVALVRQVSEYIIHSGGKRLRPA